MTDLHVSLGTTDYGPDGDATLWIDGDGLHERIVTTPEVLASLFEEIHAAEPTLDFVVATGDLTNDGTEDEFAAYAEAVAASPVRVVSIPGNHDHHQALAAAMAGEPLPYERHVGPRWFSFDEGGVHVVAMDWFTHRLGVDTAIQEAWLADDLAAVPEGTPVVLLSHDQMPDEFFDRLPRRPVLALSGHWHTSRVVHDGRTLHVNTGPGTFGGLDHCPPHYRVVTVDDDGGVDLRTVVRGRPGFEGATVRLGPRPRPSGPARWCVPLGGGAHAGGPVVAGELVLAAGKDEDRGASRLVAVVASTGEVAWAADLDGTVKATPTVADDAVLVVTVDGRLSCFALATGELRWSTDLHEDRHRLWAHLRPVVHDGLVVAGDVGRLAAHDVATGGVVWRRDDLGHRENLTTVVRPAVVNGLLVGAFVGQAPPMFALDPATGATRWPDGPVVGIYQAGGDLAANLPRVVVGGVTPDPDGADCYVVRLGSRLERLRVADGETVWSSPFVGWFNPAPPVVAGDAVVATASIGEVRCYDRETGEPRWSTEVSVDGPVAFGAYRADGASVLAPVLPSGDRLLQPCGDGRVVALDVVTGGVVGEVDAGVPIVAPLAAAGDGVVVAVGVDGWLRALPEPGA